MPSGFRALATTLPAAGPTPQAHSSALAVTVHPDCMQGLPAARLKHMSRHAWQLEQPHAKKLLSAQLCSFHSLHADTDKACLIGSCCMLSPWHCKLPTAPADSVKCQHAMHARSVCMSAYCGYWTISMQALMPEHCAAEPQQRQRYRCKGEWSCSLVFAFVASTVRQSQQAKWCLSCLQKHKSFQIQLLSSNLHSRDLVTVWRLQPNDATGMHCVRFSSWPSNAAISAASRSLGLLN